MLKLQPPAESRCRGQLLERDGHRPVRWLVSGQLVVSAANVLDEGMAEGDHPGVAVLPEAAHRSQSCLQPAVVAVG
jgi:hypothetical protein